MIQIHTMCEWRAGQSSKHAVAVGESRSRSVIEVSPGPAGHRCANVSMYLFRNMRWLQQSYSSLGKLTTNINVYQTKLEFAHPKYCWASEKALAKLNSHHFSVIATTLPSLRLLQINLPTWRNWNLPRKCKIYPETEIYTENATCMPRRRLHSTPA